MQFPMETAFSLFKCVVYVYGFTFYISWPAFLRQPGVSVFTPVIALKQYERTVSVHLHLLMLRQFCFCMNEKHCPLKLWTFDVSGTWGHHYYTIVHKVTSLLFDQAVLQIVDVMLRDLCRVCVCLLYRGMTGMAATRRECLFCDQHQLKSFIKIINIYMHNTLIKRIRLPLSHFPNRLWNLK